MGWLKSLFKGKTNEKLQQDNTFKINVEKFIFEISKLNNQPQTNQIFEEKANLVGQFIFILSDKAFNDLVCKIKKNYRLTIEEKNEIFSEISLLYLHLLGRIMLTKLPSKAADFMQNTLMSYLNVVDDKIGEKLMEIGKERELEYYKYRIGSEKNDSPKDELGWEFGKKIGYILKTA